jgi:hypothetical protein
LRPGFQFVVREWIDAWAWRRDCPRVIVGIWPFRRWRDLRAPAVYLYFDQSRLFTKQLWQRAFPGLAAAEAAE